MTNEGGEKKKKKSSEKDSLNRGGMKTWRAIRPKTHKKAGKK